MLELNASRPEALELKVELDGSEGSALAYPAVVGTPRPGDRVLLNTTAVHLGLGTGGMHLVVAVDSVDATDLGHDGRVMKARYTPQQVAVPTVEDEHRDAMEASTGLRGTPVVCAPLHSIMGVAATGARAAGARRIVYVMTDGAALAGAVSRLVPRLLEAGLVDDWITCGQAFGGRFEAVTAWSAMLAAVEVLEADVVVVADGPGNLGTETTWGVSALGSGLALNAAATLGGAAVAALRVSFADPRERHRGVSHHSLTILERVCTAHATVAVPALEDEDQRSSVWDALRSRKLEERHQLVEADGRPALDELERRGLEIESMGRTPRDDPAFFLAAGAAGVLAGRIAARSRAYRSG